MSGAQTSTFADPNILYKTLSGAGTQEVEANRLLNVQRGQDIAANNTEVVARAASTLIDPTLYPTEEARAAAWPGIIGQLKANGYAPNAPAEYPGLAHLQVAARMGTPSQTQAEWGFNLRTNQAYTDASKPPTATAPASTGGAPSGAIEPDALARAQAVRDGLIRRGLDTDTATAFAANALHESSANPNTGAGDQGASHGLFQWRDDRYNRYKSVFGGAPDNAPLDQQLDYVIHELNTTEGAARDRIAAAQGPAAKASAVSQFYLRPKDVQAEAARRSGTATQLVSQWGGAGTSTPGQPVIAGDSLATADGLGGTGVKSARPDQVLASVRADSRAGKYNGQPVVLSTGASNNPADFDSIEQQIREVQGGNAGRITVLGVGPAVEAKAPGTNAKLQALAKSYGATFVPLPADQMSADGVHPTAQGYATLKAAVAPAQGAPGGVAARTGGVNVAG
ncbi:MAG TPA: phage tail tip lysozyme, partial [Steroidobacteraceae bacterium]